MADLFQKKIISYLDYEFTEPVRDPVWGNIMFSHEFKKIVSSSVLQKMNRIRQLGPAYLVYPGAVHTRFLHSLGVYHVGYRIIRQLLTFPSCPVLTLEGVKGFLCACLLHDLGHFPYTHSLKEFPLKEHEVLTGEYILSDPLNDLIKNALRINPFIPAAIVDKNLSCDNQEVAFFRNILSGVMDPDKLDYLTRDAWFCGVPYGIQDLDFVISAIYPHPENGISILPSGVPAVENILFSKYLMYKTVYWHKAVRSATGMIKKAIMDALEKGNLRPEELYNLDDESLLKVGGKLFTMVHDRQLYKMVYEEVFDEKSLSHNSLLDLTCRSNNEKKLIEQIAACGIFCGENSIFIDVPENINFETTLPVFDNGTFRNFSGSRGLGAFSEPLRKLRIFADPVIADSIRNLREIKWF